MAGAGLDGLLHVRGEIGCECKCHAQATHSSV